MPKLNQIIAIENGTKTSTGKDLNEVYHALQKPALLAGIARKYTPKDDEGEKFPAESTPVQARARDMLKATGEIMTKLLDVTATKDWANCSARADVKIDGTVLLSSVPVTYLLFLEKRLVDLATLVKSLPTLDASESWKFDTATNCYASEPSETLKSKKIPRNHIKAEATDKHPAQVDVWHEDVIVGRWNTIKYSGALPATTQKEILGRVDQLREAVKFAREEANNIDVTRQDVGAKLFSFVLGAS